MMNHSEYKKEQKKREHKNNCAIHSFVTFQVSI